jgi:seryl-tRNA synthetase
MAKKRKKTGVSKVVIIEKKVEHRVERKKRLSNREIQELLIDNFVGLQKAMTNLSFKFEALAEQNAKLLQIFELAAKNYISGETGEQKKDVIDKINSLLEQNKVIAGGLVMLEEQLRNQTPEIERREERTVVQAQGNPGMPRNIPRI